MKDRLVEILDEHAHDIRENIDSFGAAWAIRDALVPGEPCPTCGRRVPMSSTERVRRWRARKKEQQGGASQD